MNRPRVFLFIPTSRSGVARYAFELASALYAIGDVEAILIAPDDFEFLNQMRPVSRCRMISPIRGKNVVAISTSMLIQIFQLTRHIFHSRKIGHGKPVVHVLTNYVAPLQLVAHFLLGVVGATIYYTAHDVSPHHKSGLKVINGLNHILFRFIYRLADFIHVHTEMQRTELMNSYSVPAGKVTLIPHGLNLITPTPARQTDGKMVKLIVLGAIRANKQIVETIDAVIGLQKLGHQLQLEIFGAGSRLERGYLRQVGERSQCAGSGVYFSEGFVQEEEFDKLLQSCDAVVLPYGEFSSQSGVALRAIRNGCFIIGTPQCGGDLPISDVLGLSISGSAGVRDIRAGIEAYLATSAAERTRRMEQLRILVAGKMAWAVVCQSFANWYNPQLDRY